MWVWKCVCLNVQVVTAISDEYHLIKIHYHSGMMMIIIKKHYQSESPVSSAASGSGALPSACIACNEQIIYSVIFLCSLDTEMRCLQLCSRHAAYVCAQVRAPVSRTCVQIAARARMRREDTRAREQSREQGRERGGEAKRRGRAAVTHLNPNPKPKPKL